jgi:hypothetical protein
MKRPSKSTTYREKGLIRGTLSTPTRSIRPRTAEVAAGRIWHAKQQGIRSVSTKPPALSKAALRVCNERHKRRTTCSHQ